MRLALTALVLVVAGCDPARGESMPPPPPLPPGEPPGLPPPVVNLPFTGTLDCDSYRAYGRPAPWHEAELPLGIHPCSRNHVFGLGMLVWNSRAAFAAEPHDVGAGVGFNLLV